MSNELPAEKDGPSLPQPAVQQDSPGTLLHTAQLFANPREVFSYRHWMGDVDPQQSTFPLAAYCFMTGFMYVFSSRLLFFSSGVAYLYSAFILYLFSLLPRLGAQSARGPRWHGNVVSLCSPAHVALP